MRPRLRLPHPGQRVSGAPAGHQDLQEGPASRPAHRQDERAYQEDHHTGAESAVRYAQRLRGVARGVAGTTACALQVPVCTMEPAASLFVVRVVERCRRAATDRSESRRAAAIQSRAARSRSRSRSLRASLSRRTDPEECPLRSVEVFERSPMNSSPCQVLTVPNKRTNKCA